MSEDVYNEQKLSLIKDDHPLIRSIREIREILFHEDDPLLHKRECLSLKELFLKVNMDHYHVDCLVLYKIALNMIAIQEKLMERHVYPGLYDIADVYVDLSDSACPLYLTHPERFQLLSIEQDYEWYPEDERIFGDISLFDEESQTKANQRFLYRILIASFRGNVKVPPLATSQDYSNLFYGTLNPRWKECFEKGRIMTSSQWTDELMEAVRCEEAYEKETKRRKKDAVSRSNDANLSRNEAETAGLQAKSSHITQEVYALYVILRAECRNSLEMSKMLYESQDRMEEEQGHSRFLLKQGFIYGDAVVKRRDFAVYPNGFRMQIPQNIKDYSMVEALLIACDHLEFSKKQKEDPNRSYRMYILSDGKIQNDQSFQKCLKKLAFLKADGIQIFLVSGKGSSCEGWEQLKNITEIAQ